MRRKLLAVAAVWVTAAPRGAALVSLGATSLSGRGGSLAAATASLGDHHQPPPQQHLPHHRHQPATQGLVVEPASRGAERGPPVAKEAVESARRDPSVPESRREGGLFGGAERVSAAMARVARGWRGNERWVWAVRRSGAIWACAANFALKWSRLRRSKLQKEALVEARRALAGEFRETLLRLGPTFIKFGQLLSTRVDALPREVISELVSLQNEVPGFATERAVAIVESELDGFPFESFERVPLAAASLAQVHRARLRNGDEVVVKIQRDGLEKQFAVDCANIRFLARLADALDPQEEGVAANWRDIAESCERVLYREIDFRVERQSAERFRRNFERCPYVKIPKTYEELSTRRVLVMEYVAGRKINDPPETCDPVALASRLTTSYLDQLCRHGFFHCDPHPGNVACDDAYPGGRIIYYDFGMMETIEPEVKKGFVDLVFSLYKNEPLVAVDALETMGVLRPTIDRYSIERIARTYVNTFAETVSGEALWDNQLDAEDARRRRRARRAKLGADLFSAQADRPFVLPPKFTFVFRAVSTIDGIGKSLDRTFDLTKLASPYMRELADLRDGSAFKTAALELLQRLGLRPADLGQVVTQPRTVANLDRSLRRLETGELKLRVRAVECESTVERIETRQKLTTFALAAGLLLNAASGPAALFESKLANFLLSKLALLASAACAFKAFSAYRALDALERRKTRFFNLDKQDDDMLL